MIKNRELRHRLSQMMLESHPLDEMTRQIDACQDTDVLYFLLDFTYTELSYVSVGGDLGSLDNPPIDTEKMAYLEELIEIIESRGIKFPETIEE